MTTHPLDITPLGTQIGAAIANVDLSQSLDDATFAAIEQAFAEWSVIVFRNQHITPAQQLPFARRFGAPGICL